VIVGPEFAGGADAGLHFVDDEHDVIAFCDLAETAEEGRGGVIVAAFGLDGLYDDGGNWVVEGLDQLFRFCEASSFFFGVLFRVFGERVFDVWE